MDHYGNSARLLTHTNPERTLTRDLLLSPTLGHSTEEVRFQLALREADVTDGHSMGLDESWFKFEFSFQSCCKANKEVLEMMDGAHEDPQTCFLYLEVHVQHLVIGTVCKHELVLSYSP